MESVTLIAAGWGSGINAYLTVLILGIAGRAGWVDAPDSMEQWWVLGVAAVLFVVEFVADKVASYKKIRIVEFIDEIPKSASGKILRRFLRDGQE